jgi:hypothetical protein
VLSSHRDEALGGGAGLIGVRNLTMKRIRWTGSTDGLSEKNMFGLYGVRVS